jgi:hypothetical protein
MSSGEDEKSARHTQRLVGQLKGHEGSHKHRNRGFKRSVVRWRYIRMVRTFIRIGYEQSTETATSNLTTCTTVPCGPSVGRLPKMGDSVTSPKTKYPAVATIRYLQVESDRSTQNPHTTSTTIEPQALKRVQSEGETATKHPKQRRNIETATKHAVTQTSPSTGTWLGRERQQRFISSNPPSALKQEKETLK